MCTFQVHTLCIWEGGNKNVQLFKVGEHDTSKTNSGEKWNRICDVKKHPNYKGKRYEIVPQTMPANYKLFEYFENDIAVLTLCTELKFEPKVI